jgi:hypothetical protein
MLRLDASFRLRLSSGKQGRIKGSNKMSDEWIGNAVQKIQQAEEDKKRKEAFELMRERKLEASEHDMFTGLQNCLKGAIEKFYCQKAVLMQSEGGYGEVVGYEIYAP